MNSLQLTKEVDKKDLVSDIFLLKVKLVLPLSIDPTIPTIFKWAYFVNTWKTPTDKIPISEKGQKNTQKTSKKTPSWLPLA